MGRKESNQTNKHNRSTVNTYKKEVRQRSGKDTIDTTPDQDTDGKVTISAFPINSSNHFRNETFWCDHGETRCQTRCQAIVRS